MEVYDELEKALKEIERLNNIINNDDVYGYIKHLEDLITKKDTIINELEKWLNEKICLNKNDKDYVNGMTFVGVNLQMYQMFLDKLQELKGSVSNE